MSLQFRSISARGFVTISLQFRCMSAKFVTISVQGSGRLCEGSGRDLGGIWEGFGMDLGDILGVFLDMFSMVFLFEVVWLVSPN